MLILGASGFIGSHLAARLLSKHRVIGYSRCIPEHLINEPNYRHISGNFVSEDSFPALLKANRISCIYHCISTTTPRSGTGYAIAEVCENLVPTLRLLDAAVYSGVQRIIFISSGGTVYGEQLDGAAHTEGKQLRPVCSYGAQKASIEAYLNVYSHVHSLTTIIARVSNPYGYGLRENHLQGIIPIFLKALYEGRGITLFGDTVRDYIYIDDVIDALVKLNDYSGDGRIFNIGFGQGIYLHQLVQMMESMTGKAFKSVNHQPVRDCDVACNILDIEHTRRELQWEPKIDLEHGIRGMIQEFSVGRVRENRDILIEG